MIEREHERVEGQREKQTPCWAGSPMWDSILGLQDHDLSRRQSLNQLSHPGARATQAPWRGFLAKPDVSGCGALLWQTAVSPCSISVIVQACFSQVPHSFGPAQQKGEARRGVPWWLSSPVCGQAGEEAGLLSERADTCTLASGLGSFLAWSLT